MEDKLTTTQIENWRKDLVCIFGIPYALIMPDEYVQAYKNKLKEQADALE